MSQDNTHTTVFAGRDESASSTLKKIGLHADETGSKLSKMGTLAGGFALGNMLSNAIRDVKNFAQQSIGQYKAVGAEVLKLQRSTGGTAEDASKLRYAMEESGLSVDTAGLSIKQFSKHVAANDSAIKAMSVTTKDANGNFLSTNQILLNVADRFASMPNGIEKTALAVNLFGRNGQTMLEFLNKGKAGLTELENEAAKYGLVLTQNNLDAIQKNIIAHRQYTAAMQGAQLQIGQQLLPIMTQMTQGFTDFLVQIRPVIADMSVGLKPAVEDVANALKGALTIFAAFMKFLADNKGAATAFGDAFVGLAAGLTAYKMAAAAAKTETLGLNAALATTPLGVIAALIGLFAGLVMAENSGHTPGTVTGSGKYTSTGGRGAHGSLNFVPTQAEGTVGGGISFGRTPQLNHVNAPVWKPTPTTKTNTATFNLAKAVGVDYAKGLEGTTANIAAEITKMIDTAYSAAKAGKTDPTQLINALKTQQKQLQTLAADRDLTIKRLTTAQADLKNLQDQSKQLSDQIASGIVSSYSITSGTNPQTLGEMISGMTRNVDRAKQLAAALKTLKSQGLDAALLKDIASAGTERGLDVAQQIMVGGAGGVAQLNTLQSAIADYAKQAGDTVGDATYAGGISTAQKLVDSLVDEKAKILASIDDLSTSITKIFDLSITALFDGIQKKGDTLAAQLKALQNSYPGTGALLDPTQVTKPVPVVVNPTTSSSDYASTRAGERGDININISGSIGSHDIAQTVVTSIQTLNRTNGRVADWLP